LTKLLAVNQNMIVSSGFC